jgi:hypothetical protein
LKFSEWLTKPNIDPTKRLADLYAEWRREEEEREAAAYDLDRRDERNISAMMGGERFRY